MEEIAMQHTGSRKKLISGALAATLALGLGVSAFAPKGSDASSHREAPLTAAEPQIDQTDLYTFTSPDAPNTVTFVSNWIPFEEPAGGPNFYSFAEGVRYDVNISNDGDALPETIYRWTFANHTRYPDSQFLYNIGPVTSLNDQDLNFYQTYDLKEIDKDAGTKKTLVNDAIVAPSDVGKASMPSYEDLRDEAIETISTDGGPGKSYVGQANDSFFLDLRVFDLLYGGDFSEAGDDTLEGFNVNTMVLQVPKTDVAKGGNVANNPVIGVWNTASRRSIRVQDKATGALAYEGRFVQVSRLGNPLVNEVVVPIGFKDYFNASKPKNDAQFLEAVDNPILPKNIEAVYGIPQPDSNDQKPGIQRDDLIAVFLTGLEGLNQPAGVQPSELLRFNLTTPLCEEGTCAEYSRLGVIGGDNAGYPNGRRLADDVVDIALQVVEGELLDNPNDLADGVNRDDKEFLDFFPYVSLPTRGSDPAPHEGGPESQPSP